MKIARWIILTLLSAAATTLFLEVVYLFLLFGFGFLCVCLFVLGTESGCVPRLNLNSLCSPVWSQTQDSPPKFHDCRHASLYTDSWSTSEKRKLGVGGLYRPIYPWPHSQAVPELGHDFYWEPCVLCQIASCIRSPDWRNACISPFLCFCEHYLPAIGFWGLEMSQSHL